MYYTVSPVHKEEAKCDVLLHLPGKKKKKVITSYLLIKILHLYPKDSPCSFLRRDVFEHTVVQISYCNDEPD